MADPFSLAVNIYTTFKEVYLVSRFMYSLAISAKEYAKERKQLSLEFEHEILFLQSLGRIYLLPDGQASIVNDPNLDRLWAKQLANVLEQMRSVSVDYARLAQAEDPDYKEHSPVLNDHLANSTLIEFDLDKPLPKPSKAFSTSSLLKWLNLRASHKVNESIEGWHWALREKKKFEHIVHEFQRLNGKLKDILPLWTAAQIKLSNRPATTSQSTRSFVENTTRLGVEQHARLRQISSRLDEEGPDLILPGRAVQIASEAKPLALGTMLKGQKVEEKNVLVEYKEYAPDDSSMSAAVACKIASPHATQLARLLNSSGEYGLSTLPFHGFVHEEAKGRYAFIFSYPPDADPYKPPISLHRLIETNDLDNRLDLKQRFEVAQVIARSLGAFHADGWVHKSLRSDSIIFFHKETGPEVSQTRRSTVKPPAMLSPPFLANFSFSRPEGEATKLEPDSDLSRNLYRHPERQGAPSIGFSKVHDIYALGIVLLEIGLWQPAASIYQDAMSGLPHQPDAISVSARGLEKHLKGINVILKTAAKKRLAHHMGRPYAEAVLKCIDDSFKDRTSTEEFPTQFFEEVVSKLTLDAAE